MLLQAWLCRSRFRGSQGSLQRFPHLGSCLECLVWLYPWRVPPYLVGTRSEICLRWNSSHFCLHLPLPCTCTSCRPITPTQYIVFSMLIDTTDTLSVALGIGVFLSLSTPTCQWEVKYSVVISWKDSEVIKQRETAPQDNRWLCIPSGYIVQSASDISLVQLTWVPMKISWKGSRSH